MELMNAPVVGCDRGRAQRAGEGAIVSRYMRDLPAPLAADCLNYGLHHNRDVAECGVLLTRSAGNVPTHPAVARAVTGPNVPAASCPLLTESRT